MILINAPKETSPPPLPLSPGGHPWASCGGLPVLGIFREWNPEVWTPVSSFLA